MNYVVGLPYIAGYGYIWVKRLYVIGIGYEVAEPLGLRKVV